MAVAFDAFSASSAGTGNLSWTHTPVGTPRVIIVFIIQNTATDDISTVTYGGTSMVEVTGSPHEKTSGEAGVVYCYTLLSSVPTGAQTVLATVAGATTKVAGAISLTASANGEIVDIGTSISSNSLANPSETLTLGGKTSFAAIGFFSGHGAASGISPLANWTDRLEHDYGSKMAGIYTYDTIGSTNVTSGWTQTADDALAISIAVSEAAAVSGWGRLLGQFRNRFVRIGSILAPISQIRQKAA